MAELETLIEKLKMIASALITTITAVRLEILMKTTLITMKSFKCRLSQCCRKYNVFIYDESVIYLSQISFRFN